MAVATFERVSTQKKKGPKIPIGRTRHTRHVSKIPFSWVKTWQSLRMVITDYRQLTVAQWPIAHQTKHQTQRYPILQLIVLEWQIASCLQLTPHIIWGSFFIFPSTKPGNHIGKGKLYMIELQE